MFKLALKSILGRKRRLVGTAMAVVLGVAFLAGTLVFTDTMSRSLDGMFTEMYRGIDTVVRSEESVEMDMGPSVRARLPEATLAAVQAVDGVAVAQADVGGYAQIVGADGEPIGNPGQGAPTFGMTYREGDLIAWELTAGSRAPGPGEVVIDKGSADRGELRIGDTITVLTQGGPRELLLVGTTRFAGMDSPSGASVSLLDVATAQAILAGGQPMLDSIYIAAEPGVGEEELTRRVTAVLPDGLEAITGTALTEENQNVMAELMNYLTTFLLVFAVIGLVVACFTIFNTFQITVTQRLRETALMRAVGATRAQVLGSQLIEAVLIGVGASGVGLGAGVGVATLLKRLMGGLGLDLPTTGSVILARTVVVAFAVGTLATVVSALLPAWRASKAAPLEALRETNVDRSASSPGRLTTGGLATAAGVAAFVAGLAGGELLWVGLGALLVFFGVFVLGPVLSRPATRLLGLPLEKARGIAGRLARDNATRNPKRTARTGGALMVGVALVVAINMIAASAKLWVRDVVAEQFSGDFVVESNVWGYGGLPIELAGELGALPEIEVATGVRVGFATIGEGVEAADDFYTVIDPPAANRLFDIGQESGDLTSLDERGVLMLQKKADELGVTVGDTVTFRFVDGTERALEVQGTYAKDELAGNFVVSQALHESTGVDQFDFSVYIEAADGVTPAAAATAMAPIIADYPNADLQSNQEYMDAMAAQVDPIVNLMYALLALAVGIALFSIANSMALSVHERTREIGLLRAVGMDRGQTRATIRWEAVLIALVGTLSGLAIGVFFGWALSVTLMGEGLAEFAFPATAIAVIAVAAVVGGVLASTRPARRAARVDVLRAITTE